MRKRSAEVTSGMLDEARQDVVHADSKASTIFAALGIGYGAVLGGTLSSGWSPEKLPAVGVVLWWIGASTAAAAVAAAGLAIWPRYTSKDGVGEVTYWAHAAPFVTWQSLVKAIDEQDPRDINREGHQLWRLSRIVRQKYRWVRIAMVLAAIAAILLAVATTPLLRGQT